MSSVVTCRDSAWTIDFGIGETAVWHFWAHGWGLLMSWDLESVTFASVVKFGLRRELLTCFDPFEDACVRSDEVDLKCSV